MQTLKKICIYFVISTLSVIITTIILCSFGVAKPIIFLIDIVNIALTILCIWFVNLVLNMHNPKSIVFAVAITMFTMSIMCLIIWIGTQVPADKYLHLAINLALTSVTMTIAAHIYSIITKIKNIKKNRQ